MSTTLRRHRAPFLAAVVLAAFALRPCCCAVVESENIVCIVTAEDGQTVTMEIVHEAETDTPTLASGDFRYIRSGGGAILVDYAGADPTLTIPEALDGLPVRAVGVPLRTGAGADMALVERGWFAARANLRRVAGGWGQGNCGGAQAVYAIRDVPRHR